MAEMSQLLTGFFWRLEQQDLAFDGPYDEGEEVRVLYRLYIHQSLTDQYAP